ncbi:MAG: hypothetical protein ACP5N7_02540 [Candidatus Pacearchaeota archaeon]
MSLKEFREKDLNGIVKTVFVSLITSFVVFLIAYFIRLKDIDNFMPKYGFFIFFAILSYSVILPSLKKAVCYENISCMSGMMVGMTLGMIAGFLPGFFVGSTNGMFYGSVWGMIVGITFGVWAGKCCGIMGMMEGIMAGFMGGLMGAMTAVMMFNDNLKAAGVIVFLISLVIVTGLNLIIYRETKEHDKKFENDELFTVIVSFVLTTITIWISVFGPRSALFS